MGIDVLGQLRIDGVTSTLGRRDHVVLSALAVRAGEVVAADRLAEAVWGEDPPPSWPKVVQGCVVRLRKSLGTTSIETDSSGYRLALDGDRLDSHRFEQLVERGRMLLVGGEPDRAVVALTTALELWRGSPFDVLETWGPARIETARLEELHRTAEENVLDARMLLGEHREVVSIAEARVGEQPLREHRWATYATALYRSGRQADALRALKSARRTLVEELGIEPGSELVLLEAAILHQDDSLSPAPTSPVISEQCPYKGLVPYDVDDAETYFGRTTDVSVCLDRLRSHPVLVVTGPSGSGKSSLVRAGLVPALARAGQPATVFVPGADPDAAMTSALSTSARASIVVVDQFEEVWTLGDESSTAAVAFCARLADYATTTGPVVLAIRADHVAALVVDAQLARLAEGGLHLVGSLGGESLREAIEGPAAMAGLRLEPGLVDLLVRDCEGEPGALPLLSHALAETWQRRDGRVLTVDGYRESGEIRGAVARSADRLYESLPADQRPKLRSVMLRLVSPSPAGEPVRARVATSTFGGDPDRERVLGLLVRARLVTTEEDSVELAHEALARAWPRLRSWLDEDAGGQRILRHLAAAAGGWESLGHPTTELYRGARLESTREWQEHTSPDLTVSEQAFLQASTDAATSERQSLAEQARRQARQNRRLRRSLAGVAVLLVAALVGGVVAVQQRATADREQRWAALTSLTSSSAALRSSRRDIAALLAIEAHRMAPSPATESALFGTFTASLGAMRTIRTDVHMQSGNSPAVALPDQDALAMIDGHGSVHVIDLATGDDDPYPALSDSAGGQQRLALSGDGRVLAAMWRNGNFERADARYSVVAVYDVEAHRLRFDPIRVPFIAGGLAISHDGSTLAVSGGADMQTFMYDGATGARFAEVEPLRRPAGSEEYQGNSVSVAFAPNGKLLVGTLAGPIQIVDPRTGVEQRRIEAPPMTANLTMWVSEDGSTLVTTGQDTVGRYDLATGELAWPALRPQGSQYCNSVTYAERIDALLCGEWSGRVLQIDLEAGTVLGPRYDSQQGDVCALVVSQDGARLFEVSDCQGAEPATIVEWRLDGSGPMSSLATPTTGPNYVVGYGFGGNAELLVAELADGSDGPLVTNVIDPTDGGVIERFPGVFGMQPTADDDQVLAWFDNDPADPGDDTVGVYDLVRREPVRIFDDVGFDIAMMLSAGDRAIVLGGLTEWMPPSQVRGIDLATGEVVGPIIDSVRDHDAIGDPDSYAFWIRGIRVTDDALVVSVEKPLDEGVYAIELRDLDTGAIAASAPFFNAAVGGGVIVGGTPDGRFRELDPVGLEPVGAAFAGQSGAVSILELDDDGRRFLAVGFDETIRFYDVETRTQLGDAIPTNQPGGELSAAIRYDGMQAAFGSRTGIVVWDLDPAHWIDAACTLAGRNLTHAEWDQFIGDLASYRPTCDQFPEGD